MLNCSVADGPLAKRCDILQQISLHDLALLIVASLRDNALCGAKNDSRHICHLRMRLHSVSVDRPRVKYERDWFCWVQQNNCAGIPAIVSQQLDGDAVVCIVGEVKENFIGLQVGGHEGTILFEASQTRPVGSQRVQTMRRKSRTDTRQMRTPNTEASWVSLRPPCS